VVAVDSANCVLLSQGPLVAALGVEDLVVVATPEAVLVTTREQAQKVKDLVKELERRGLHRVL
ncbi:MAG: hypothetical protein N2447_08285, partial [Thermoanaerobaculum sp.]|nr:hypothetical protein [Thermoanaerobaculum sp.]